MAREVYAGGDAAVNIAGFTPAGKAITAASTKAVVWDFANEWKLERTIGLLHRHTISGTWRNAKLWPTVRVRSVL